MDDVIYLVDNNVLTRLGREERASVFLRSQCHVTEDVLHEARGFADELGGVPVRPVSGAVLRSLAHVMGTVDPQDTSLVDLYANKGSADPVLVAVAIDMADEEAQTLVPRQVVLVTGDKAVALTAQRLGVSTLGFEDFQRVLRVAEWGGGQPRGCREDS